MEEKIITLLLSSALAITTMAFLAPTVMGVSPENSSPIDVGVRAVEVIDVNWDEQNSMNFPDISTNESVLLSNGGDIESDGYMVEVLSSTTVSYDVEYEGDGTLENASLSTNITMEVEDDPSTGTGTWQQGSGIGTGTVTLTSGEPAPSSDTQHYFEMQATSSSSLEAGLYSAQALFRVRES